jgi:hypothetical protein
MIVKNQGHGRKIRKVKKQMQKTHTEGKASATPPQKRKCFTTTQNGADHKLFCLNHKKSLIHSKCKVLTDN